MKILVTGADGLLGSNLVRVLLNRGHQLRALVQKGRLPKTIQDLDIELVEGDLLDPESLKKAGAGIDAIFHVAAHTGIWPSRSEIVNRVNIEGTTNMLALAKSIGVKRMVYVGTANTFGFGSKDQPGKEGTPYKGAQYGLDYMDSKYKAHQVVESYIREGLPVVIVNPTFMLGPYDSAPSSGAMVLAVYKEQVPGYAPGGRNYICVKDAAVGIANALEKGRIGESYIIGNRNMSYKEAFTLMADTLGVKAPKLPMPKFLVLSYGLINQTLAKLAGKKPKVSYPMAKISCDTHYFTAEKAVRELGLPQSPIEEGIRESLQWMKENGMVDE
jgi:dihydroflavonol-4-reductase